MPTVKGSYEAVMVFSVAAGDEAATALVARFKELIEQNAEMTKIDEWGKRKLAYLINDEADGYYVLYEFTANPEFPTELYRIAGITEGVLRTLVVRKDA